MSDTPRTDALIYRKNTIEMQRHELLDLALALERELAEVKEQLRLCNVDQFTTAAELAEAKAQRDEKDKQLATCYDRMNKAEAQRDKAIAFLHVYRNDTPLGNQPHMLAHEVDQFLKECGK